LNTTTQIINSSAGQLDSQVVGLDIGGANIKLSDGLSWHRHQPFALWQQPQLLKNQLMELLKRAPPHQLVAITMTGELTDCFANKREGVHFITDAVCEATTEQVSVYLLDGRFVDASIAKTEYELAAASNWHALANQLANSIATTQAGMLIDIGSTTTDLIPFENGQVLTGCRDDFGRMTHFQLVYTGAIRSNLAGIVSQVSHRGQNCPVMNEMFATTLDTNIVLGHIPMGTQQHYSADGLPTKIEDCIRRIARLIGKDDLTFDQTDAVELARQVYQNQIANIVNAARNVLNQHSFTNVHLIVSGQGEFLAADVAEALSDDFPVQQITRFSSMVDANASDCATAWSIAKLANPSLAALIAKDKTSRTGDGSKA